jgi:hypothetical protein
MNPIWYLAHFRGCSGPKATTFSRQYAVSGLFVLLLPRIISHNAQRPIPGRLVMATKTADALTVGDIVKHPVWRYRGSDDTAIEPVLRLPCTNLSGKLVGTQVALADGTTVWALLGNIDTASPELSKHFLTISIESNGQWFYLARYFDIGYDDESGPAQLSGFLKKPIGDIFPITFDIRRIFKRESAALRGKIEKEPSDRLTREEIIRMAVP